MKIPILIALASVFAANAGAQNDAYPWKAAVASVDITPTEFGWMAGYASRSGPAEGVRQPLFAKALAIEDADGGRQVIVTLDLIGVPKPLRIDIEKTVAESHGLKPEQLLMNASHTHSGPEIRLFRPNGGKGEPRVGYNKIPEEDQPLRVGQIQSYNAELRKKIGAAIAEAIEGLEPAKLSWSRARCGFAMNRRTPMNDDFRNFPNPDGPVDHDVPVLQVRDAKNRLVGVLFGYACHATTLSDLQLHGDWPGFAQHYFEATVWKTFWIF
ncbi:MAG: neutral ceramidase [Verrucomicrobiales bacterium]|jgi:neutral ceramidase